MGCNNDIQTTTHTVVALAPQAVTATVNGLVIDTFKAESLSVDVFAGALTAADASNYVEFKLQHGAESGLSDAADVPVADMIIDGTPGDYSPSGSTADNPALPRCNATSLANTRVARIGYRGTKRYVRVVATETGTFDGFLAAIGLQGHLSSSPWQ